MSQTEKNLQEAFAGESQANRKYLAFAKEKVLSAALFPSDFAVSLMSGYILLNSWVSPATASLRFSAVEFIPLRTLRCAWAWTVSASAAALKRLATRG